jgi:hypothetical protein
MRTQFLVLVSTMLAGMIVGCFSDPVAVTCPAGAEGCECADDFTCEPGLMCMNGHCRADGGDTGSTSETASTSETETTEDTETTDDTETETTDDTETETETGEDLCGNLVLDADEQCDGGPGCTDCELDNYDCNPLNNVGCIPGTKCSYVPPNYDFACLVFDPNPPLAWGESNCYNFEPKDEACDVGLSCTPGQVTEQCPDGACCTYYCNLLDPEFDCGTPGDSCVKFFTGPEPSGLEWLGFCSNL